jgi:hypothetical protein
VGIDNDQLAADARFAVAWPAFLRRLVRRSTGDEGSGSASAAARSSSHAPRMHASIAPGSGTMLRHDTIETHITPL